MNDKASQETCGVPDCEIGTFGQQALAVNGPVVQL